VVDSEFNEVDYLAVNPDVAMAVKEGAFRCGREHYEQYGKSEGRMLKSLFGRASRAKKIFHLLDKKGLGLEIGPSHNPIAPKNKGFNVHILDHLNAIDLRSKYRGHGVNIGNIEEVDFVWNGEPIDALIGKTGCYDWIIASHVIEHVPDLISCFQQCEALLKPNGMMSLVIPDKRFCFDYFSSVSSTGSVLDAYAEKRTRPSHGQIFDYIANASKRDGNITWGSGGADELIHTFVDARAQYDLSIAMKDYIDAHCWRFTPSSFRLMMVDLQMLDLTGLGVIKEFDTAGFEFFVTLGKCAVPAPTQQNRIEILRKIQQGT